jgi:hypothetical protein
VGGSLFSFAARLEFDLRFQREALLGAYLVSVSGGHQADLAEPHRPNRDSAKTITYIEIGTILAFPTT